MSNELAIANMKVPAHIAARMAAPSVLASSIAGGLSQAGGPRVSIRGGRFRIVEDGDEVELPSLTLDAVIVGANPRMSKVFYAKTWEVGDAAAPDCWSDNAIAPDASCTAPQSDMCATCPKNEWGSKITPQGKEIKACQDIKKLAIISADDMEGPVYGLSITPAALKNLNAYNLELKRNGVPPELVVTSVGLDTSGGFPKLTFAFLRFMNEDELAVADSIFGNAAVMLAIGNTDAPVTQTEAKAAPAKVAKPEPVQEVVQEEPAAPKRGFGAKAAPAATKAKGFGAAKAAPKTEKVVEKEVEAEVVTEFASLDSAVDAILAGNNSDEG